VQAYKSLQKQKPLQAFISFCTFFQLCKPYKLLQAFPGFLQAFLSFSKAFISFCELLQAFASFYKLLQAFAAFASLY
jgi:hypothetical protein